MHGNFICEIAGLSEPIKAKWEPTKMLKKDVVQYTLKFYK